MMEREQRAKARVFSVELNSGSEVKKLNVPNGAQRFLLEGTIGVLKQADFVEDSVLELIGTTGVLRVDLSREDLVRPSKDRRAKVR
jgi:hypothetical protein